jgi:hypothetical protein
MAFSVPVSLHCIRVWAICSFLRQNGEEASINRKDVQIHNNLTLYCGFNEEIEWIEGSYWRRKPSHNIFLKSFHLLVHMIAYVN